MKKRYLLALTFAACLSVFSIDAKAQNHITTTLSLDGKPTFTITKSGVCLLLSQKGEILNIVINASGDVSYNIHEKVDRIGDVEVSYDIHGRIDKIGGTDISYDIHGRMDEIGEDDIEYDLSGRITKIGSTEISYHFVTGNIERIKG